VKKRQFERVDCRTTALITYQGRAFRGEVENLSLKGLFVKTDQKIDLNETVQVTVYFNGDSGDLSFGIEGKVVRCDEQGIGLSFQKIDTKSLVHTLNSGTTDTNAPPGTDCLACTAA
jgi:hypothetical protein